MFSEQSQIASDQPGTDLFDEVGFALERVPTRFALGQLRQRVVHAADDFGIERRFHR
jgi:hypothetical protein